MLVINTTARPVTTAQASPLTRPLYATWLPVSGLTLLALGIGGGASRKRKMLRGILLGGLLALTLLLPACGSSSKAASTTGGTPAGTYTVTVSGTIPAGPGVRVDFATANGTATSGVGNDYTAQSNTLVFTSAGSQTVTVATNDDLSDEPRLTEPTQTTSVGGDQAHCAKQREDDRGHSDHMKEGPGAESTHNLVERSPGDLLDD